MKGGLGRAGAKLFGLDPDLGGPVAEARPVHMLWLRYFHGTCNIMLAADALGNAFYELGFWKPSSRHLLYKVLPLWQCFCMQALPMFGAMFTTTSMLFIAIDRLLSITFPILPVLCTLGECYQPQLGAFVGRNGTVIQLTTITLYLLLGAIIKFAYKKRTSAGATHALVLYTFSHEYRKAFKVYVHCSILERTSTVHLYNRDSIFSSTKF
uniref:Uncharacterized protein n=1 Tax=Ditylenchus dipsaci TaxID=166011 RepID=A0A915EP66_9BILA